MTCWYPMWGESWKLPSNWIWIQMNCIQIVSFHLKNYISHSVVARGYGIPARILFCVQHGKWFCERLSSLWFYVSLRMRREQTVAEAQQVACGTTDEDWHHTILHCSNWQCEWTRRRLHTWLKWHNESKSTHFAHSSEFSDKSNFVYAAHATPWMLCCVFTVQCTVHSVHFARLRLTFAQSQLMRIIWRHGNLSFFQLTAYILIHSHSLPIHFRAVSCQRN